MRIWCTVLRNNGTYKSIPAKPGQTEFELDGNKYNIKKFSIGSFGRVKILRAVYAEGCPDPLDFDIDKEMKIAKLKIDSRAIKHLTDKKILDVFNDEVFTKLEKLVIMIVIAGVAVSAVTLVLTAIILKTIVG
jgi:hypothetical protein